MQRLFSLLLVLGLCSLLRADNLVANLSTATTEYLSLQEPKAEPVRQSFVLLQGQFFPGRIRDRGLEKMSFATVARVLGHALQKKKESPLFYPASSLSSADLLIVIHWGVTVGRDRNYELEKRDNDRRHQLSVEGAAFDAAADAKARESGFERAPLDNPFNTALGGEVDYNNLEDSAQAINDAARGQSIASLLGFSGDLRKDQFSGIASEHARSLVDLMEEDRYFVLVFAYDMKRMRQEKRLVVNWTTRLSIRSAGVNFATAINRLSEAGSASFGTESKEVKFTPIKTKNLKEDIRIGDPIIIEVLDTSPRP